jgi:hypothetical protein
VRRHEVSGLPSPRGEFPGELVIALIARLLRGLDVANVVVAYA